MAVDALVALTLLSLMIPVVLGSTRLSLHGEARAVERRAAKAQLGYLLAAAPSEAAVSGGPFALRLDRAQLKANDVGVGLCTYRATAASAASRRIYQLETVKFCGGLGS